MSDNSRRDDEAFDFDTLTEQPLSTDAPTPVPDGDVKATSVRTPSRTTRIMLAFLLLAVAAFLWYNYMYQPANSPVTPLVSSPQPQATLGQAPLGGNGAINGNGQLAPLVAGNPAGPEDSVSSPDGAPVVVLPPPEIMSVMARELVISDLPFLVTEPPSAADAAEADAEAELVRPTVQRASVNPFSPVVLVTPDAPEFAGPVPDSVFADEFAAEQPAAEQVTEVSIPSGPDQAAITTIAAPVTPPVIPVATTPTGPAATPVAPPATAEVVPVAPQPVAQTQTATGSTSTSLAQALPRPLPGPAMSHVPPVLQERRAVEDIPQPNLVQVAATLEPEAAGEPLPESPSLPTADSAQDPLPPLANRVLPSDLDPLVAGITPLSRYLRDNNITFTGVVLGPMSQGVFRTLSAERPVIVALGHQLPETSIVLTELRGQEAEFTLADATQTITLDLRR